MYFAVNNVFVLILIIKTGLVHMNNDFLETKIERHKFRNLAHEFFNYGLEKHTNVGPLIEKDQPPEPIVNSDFDLTNFILQHDAVADTVTKSNQPNTKDIVGNKVDLKHRAYFLRFINIFLRDTGFMDFSESLKEDGDKTIAFDITLSKEHLTILKMFGSDDDISLESLENSFSTLLSSIKKHHSSQIIEIIPYIIYMMLVLAATYNLSSTFKGITINFSLFMFILCMTYVLLVAHDLLQQYEQIWGEMSLKRLEFGNHSAPPEECFLSKLPIYKKLYFHIFPDDTCSRYLQSRKSLWQQMDLGSAFSKPIQVLITLFFSILGEGSDKLIKPFADKCPWYIRNMLYFILSILTLLVFMLSLCILITTLYFGKISFNFPFCTVKSEKENMNKKDCHMNTQEALKDLQSNKSTVINNYEGIVYISNDSASQRQIVEDYKQLSYLKTTKRSDCDKKSFFFHNTNNVLQAEGIENSFKFNKQSEQMPLLQKGISGGSINNQTEIERNKNIEDVCLNKLLSQKYDKKFSICKGYWSKKINRRNFKIYLPLKLNKLTTARMEDLLKLHVKKKN